MRNSPLPLAVTDAEVNPADTSGDDEIDAGGVEIKQVPEDYGKDEA